MLVKRVFDFIKFRRIAFIISGSVLALGLFWILIMPLFNIGLGGFRLGIEFSGGISTKIKLVMTDERSVDVEEIREIMKDYLEERNFQEGVVVFRLPSEYGTNQYQLKMKTEAEEDRLPKHVGEERFENDILAEIEDEKLRETVRSYYNYEENVHLFSIRTDISDQDLVILDDILTEIGFKMNIADFVENEVVARLVRHFGDDIAEITILERTGFSTAFGASMGGYAFMFIFLIIALIILYITFRFQFKFGIAAVIALIHDSLLIIGIASLMGREITVPLIVAILTLLGYSLNDTIVVFDRIRENSRDIKDKDYIFIINKSISQSLNRTIITSITTELAAIPLLIVSVLIPVDVLFDIAFFLFIGILIGTYSSIFIASPVLYLWENWRSKRQELKKKKDAQGRRRVATGQA